MEADEQFYAKLQNGYRMEKPKYATKQTYETMQKCWLIDPIKRPSFFQLEEWMGSELDASIRRHLVELNDPYVASNINRRTTLINYATLIGSAGVASADFNQSSHCYVNVPSSQKENNESVSIFSSSTNYCL